MTANKKKQEYFLMSVRFTYFAQTLYMISP